jgi:hypothetical protein
MNFVIKKQNVYELFEHQSSVQISFLHITVVEEVDVSCLWSLESLEINPPTEKMEEVAEYAKKNVSYQDRRYVVKFSSKKEHPQLPSNFKMVSPLLRVFFRVWKKNPPSSNFQQVDSRPIGQSIH